MNIDTPGRHAITLTLFGTPHERPRQVISMELYHGALPIVDNLVRFSCIQPSRCPFCHNTQSNLEHIFLYCPEVKALWHRYAILLDGPHPTHVPLKAYLLNGE